MVLWKKGKLISRFETDSNFLFSFSPFSKLTFSDEHTRLVWALNLYLVETTSKFVNDVNILSNTVISANNILKRTTNIDQYLSILHVSTRQNIFHEDGGATWRCIRWSNWYLRNLLILSQFVKIKWPKNAHWRVKFHVSLFVLFWGLLTNSLLWPMIISVWSIGLTWLPYHVSKYAINQWGKLGNIFPSD